MKYRRFSTSTRQSPVDGLYRTGAYLPHPDPERGLVWFTVAVAKTREEAIEAAKGVIT